MEAICSTEASSDFQRTTWRYIPEDSPLHSYRCENLTSYVHYCVYKNLPLVLLLSRTNPVPAALGMHPTSYIASTLCLPEAVLGDVSFCIPEIYAYDFGSRSFDNAHVSLFSLSRRHASNSFKQLEVGDSLRSTRFRSLCNSGASELSNRVT
jgi:hypothetical protein